MPLLDDIQTYIVANSDLVFGTDLFASEMPDEPDSVTVIFQFAGNQPSRVGDNRSPGLQVRTRANTYTAGLQLIEDIYAILSLVGDEFKDDAPEGVTINGTDYLAFIPQQEPIPIGEDSKGRPEFTQNYIVTYAA